MALDTFRNLVPAFRKTGLVHLQGWGEPLLNPDFFAMADLAKSAGCRVGTTTNGMTFSEHVVSQLLESGVDSIAFSLACTDERNDSIRKGTSFAKVLEAMQMLAKAKARAGTGKPSIHLAYLLLRSCLDGAEALPSLLQNLDVSHVSISTLDFVATGELQKEALFPTDSVEYLELRAYLDAIVLAGERGGIAIGDHLGCAGHRRLACTENVQKALFVSVDGAVSPCVFSHVPVSDASSLLKSPEAHITMVFGNIAGEPLERIWRRKAYRDFRSSFSQETPHEQCRRCRKLYER
jgi:MoaA/NifB/PqqE/SkfB family radical SAM enzyme